MKLLIATDGFLPRWDGISSFLDEIIPRLKYDISVVAPDLGELKKDYGVEITRFPVISMRLADNYYASLVKPLKLRKAVKKADVVWVQCLGPIGIAAIISAKIHRKKVIMYNHMLEWEVYPKSQGSNLMKIPINVATKFLSRILYNMCDVIIVPSLEQAELLNLLRINSIKRVVHLGVDVNHYKPPDFKEVAKQDLGISPDSYVIGYAGRLSLEKDLKTLYRAFLRLSKKYKDVVLLIAGGGRPQLERMFSRRKNVILTGLKDDLAPYYKAMDVYVLPSLVETTSLTTMEAMATGLAAVATPVGFIKEYIDDGKNGFIFPKQNSYALFQKLEYLKHNPKDREKLGKNARKTIVENYSWEKTAGDIEEIMDSML